MTAANPSSESRDRELELLGELSELKRHLTEGIKPELFAHAQELYPLLAKAIDRSSKFDPDERSLLQANLMLRQLELAVGIPFLYPEPLLFSVLVLAGESLRDLRDIEEEAKIKD